MMRKRKKRRRNRGSSRQVLCRQNPMVLGKTTKEFHRRGRLDLSYAFRRIAVHIASTWVAERGAKIPRLVLFRPKWFHESLGNPIIR